MECAADFVVYLKTLAAQLVENCKVGTHVWYACIHIFKFLQRVAIKFDDHSITLMLFSQFPLSIFRQINI